MPAAPPYSPAAPGPASRHAHSKGTSATRASGPRSSGGKAAASNSPESIAAARRRGISALDAIGAEHPFCVGELARMLDQEARAADELAGALGRDPGARLGSVVAFAVILVLVVLLFVEEPAGGPLEEQYVERLLNVVGAQLLLEVDDLVLVVFRFLLGDYVVAALYDEDVLL